MSTIETLLSEIEAREKAATPGPMSFDEDDEGYWVENAQGGCIQGFLCREDAQFFAAARTDVPKLVAALRRAIEGRICKQCLADIEAILKGVH